MRATPIRQRSAVAAAALTLGLSLSACADNQDEPPTTATTTVVASPTTNGNPDPTSELPNPTEGNADPAPGPTLPEPEPQAAPEQGADTPPTDQSNGSDDPNDPTYNCRNRVAPPLNEAQLPVLDGRTFHYRVKDNRFDPCQQLSWITVMGELDGPRQAVLLYHYGNPVATVQPLLVSAVNSVTRANHAVVNVDAVATDGTHGRISYQATVDGVVETGSSLGGQRLAGSSTH